MAIRSSSTEPSAGTGVAVLLLAAMCLCSCGPADSAARAPVARPQPPPPATPAVAAPQPTRELVRTPTVALPGVDLALGRPYTLSEPPNYPLCTDPDDARQLTDGAFSQGWFWVEKPTVGWRDKPVVVIDIDLGAVQPVGTIAFDTAGSRKTAADAGVSLPDCRMLVSDDGEIYHQVAAFRGCDLDDLPDTYVRRYRADGLAVAARHVAIVVVATGRFSFCDEIEVMRGEQALPAGGPAIRLDRIVDFLAGDRAMAGLRATVTANLRAAGETTALSALAGQPDAAWCQANARLAAGRCPGQELIVWRRDIWQDYTCAELPPAGAVAPTGLEVVLGSVESESTGCALTNASAQPIRVRAAVTPLGGPGGALPAVTLRTDAFSDALDGIARPDALPLLDDDGAVIEPGCTRQIWLTVRSDGQAAGTYTGRLTLSTPAGSREIPVRAELVDVALPRPLPFDTLCWSYLYFPLAQADPDAAIRDLAAHRITTTVLEASTLPRFAVAADGSLATADYTAFDTTIKRFQAAGIGRFIFFAFFGDGSGMRAPLGCNVTAPPGMVVGDPIWQVAMTAVYRDWIRHCLGIGLDYGAFAFFPFDEPSDALVAKGAPVYAAIKAADARARIFVTVVVPATPPGLAGIAPRIDVWCHEVLRGRPFDPAKRAFYDERQRSGAALWLYNCEGPDKSFHPLGHYRQLFWQAWEAGATGVGVWNYADTGPMQGGHSAWTDLDHQDFALVYDAATAPAGVSRQEAQIPSRRWEAFRDGTEDLAYLYALRQAAATARARGTPDAAAEATLVEVAAQVAAAPAAGATYDAVHRRLLRALDAIRTGRR